MNLDINAAQVIQVVMAGLLTAAIIANVQAYSALNSLALTVEYMQSSQVVLEARLQRLEDRRYE